MIQKQFANAAKAAITIAIIWLVLRHIDLTPVASRLLRLGPLQVVVGLLPFVIQLTFAADRWRIVCDRLGVALRFLSALEIVAIGTFFNQTLPSAIGGDAMRVWLLVRGRVSFGKAINTVLCDRVFALVILIALSAITLPLFYERVANSSARSLVTASVVIGVIGVAIFLMLGDGISHLLRRWKPTRPFGDLASDFHRLFSRPSTTLALIAWSFSIHLLTVVATWLLARLLAIEMNFFDSLVVMPSVILITMLPVSIAGWGVREGAMVVGFGLVGITPSDALAISICMGLANMILGLPGGFLWLWNRQVATPRTSSARD